MQILSDEDFATRRRQTTQEPGERVAYVALARPGNCAPTAGRVGGDGRPLESREVRVVAPPVVPDGIPAPTRNPNAVPTAEPVDGQLVGRGGPSRGLEPNYS